MGDIRNSRMANARIRWVVAALAIEQVQRAADAEALGLTAGGAL
jgi:hypothetical protein